MEVGGRRRWRFGRGDRPVEVSWDGISPLWFVFLYFSSPTPKIGGGRLKWLGCSVQSRYAGEQRRPSGRVSAPCWVRAVSSWICAEIRPYPLRP